MTNREGFIGRLSEALGRAEGGPVQPPVPPSALGLSDELPRRAAAVEELISRDAANLMDVLGRVAQTAGWNVARVDDPRSAGDYVLQVARDLEARSAAYSLHPAVLAALGDDLFAGTGIEAVSVAFDPASTESADRVRDRLRTVMANADLGITGVDFAVAETGTCVIISKAGSSRLVSLLPPVHIALVERGQVLPSLDELFTLRRSAFVGGEYGSYMNLITGPSRTADIEYKIVTGVHGPGEVHMVLIG